MRSLNLPLLLEKEERVTEVFMKIMIFITVIIKVTVESSTNISVRRTFL